MSDFHAITAEQLHDYMENHNDEFKVVIVESTLGSLISGENFEKCFVSAAQRFFEGVDDLSTAQEALRIDGFEIEIQKQTGKAYSTGKHEISVPNAVWIKIMMEVVVALFEGSMLVVFQHEKSGIKIGRKISAEQMEYFREYHGIKKDQPIEPQLLKLFGIS